MFKAYAALMKAVVNGEKNNKYSRGYYARKTEIIFGNTYEMNEPNGISEMDGAIDRYVLSDLNQGIKKGAGNETERNK